MTSCEQPDAPSSRSLHTTAWMLVGAFLFVLFVPWLFRQGMFWDGVVYGTISRNLAAGIGDAWHPTVTSTFLRHVREHPPLGFWLEAAYFWMLGDHFWVERLYSLSTLLVTGAVLLATWRWLLRDCACASACSWMAVGLWAPFGLWCYRQNMLENTMGMFTALSVYASLRALDGRRGGAACWSILAGLAMTAAILSKGPVGLFPAVTPRSPGSRCGLDSLSLWERAGVRAKGRQTLTLTLSQRARGRHKRLSRVRCRFKLLSWARWRYRLV